MTISVLEQALKRDRVLVIAGLVGVILLSWIYILAGASMSMTALEMTVVPGGSGEETAMRQGVGAMAMAAMKPMAWTPGTAVLMFFMWWIMMIAMMLPSAAPMILLYAMVNRKQSERGAPFVPTGVFAAGYIVTWGFFSALATGLQWLLEASGLLSSMMASTSVLLGGGLLIAAGAWQLSPLKHVCLKHCRTPLHFLSHKWRKGRLGAFRMGVEHGAFCLGCCWFLMGLLFYGGIMNLFWIAGLALFVLLEKTIPGGHKLGSIAGIGLLVWGGALIGAHFL